MRRLKKTAAFFTLFAPLILIVCAALRVTANADGYAVTGFAPSASLSAAVTGGFAPSAAVSVNITAETDSVLVFAVYSSDGQLRGIRTSNVTGRAGEQQVPVFPPDDMVSTDRVKLILIDADTRQPLASAVMTDSVGNALDDSASGGSGGGNSGGGAVVTYTVSFHGNGQTIGIASQSVRKDATAREPNAPFAEGYVFGGWYLNAACTIAYDFSAPVRNDLTLYAKWTRAAPTGTVTFNLSAALSYDTVVSKIAPYASDALAQMYAGYTGYDINAWYTDEDMMSRYVFRNPPAGGLSLYSIWRNGDERYHVRFHGGSDGLSFTFTDVPLNEVLPPVDLPGMAGRNFEGWFDSPSDAVPHDFTRPVTRSMTLYAKWTTPSARPCAAVLYSDGTLVFQNPDSPSSAKHGEIMKAYDIKMIADYVAADYERGLVKNVLPPWYERRWFIKAVEFADPIRPLFTSYWFYGCSNLTSVKGMENLDMSEAEGINFMFFDCSSLTELDVSGWDTGNVRDMSWAFGNCRSLKALDVSGWNGEKVRYASGVFSGCSSLMTLNVNGWGVRNVTDMSCLFSRCSNLTELNLSAWSVRSVTDMSWMFYNCGRLTKINVTGWVTGAVVDMSNMFSGCSELTTLDVSGFDTSGVKDMASMFSGCRDLMTLDVSGWNAPNVADMSGMFYNCVRLIEIDMSGWKAGAVVDMSNMFSGCSGLLSLDVSGLNTARVTSMSGAFSGCSGLTALDVSRFDTSRVTSMGSMFSGCSGLMALDVSGFDTFSAEYMGYMFSGCTNLRTIYASDKFTTDSVSGSANMFYACPALVGASGTEYNWEHTDKAYARIDIPPFAPGYFSLKGGFPIVIPPASENVYAILYDDGEMVFQVGDAPESGRKVTASYAVDMGEYRDESGARSSIPWDESRDKIQSVTFADKIAPKSTAYWFSYCTELKEINHLDRLDTVSVTNMSSMFSECAGLTSLDVSGFDTASVTDMSYMFSGCSGLARLDVSGFNTARVRSMDGMFRRCRGLVTLDVSSFNTSNVNSMVDMFFSCMSLRTIYASATFVTRSSAYSYYYGNEMFAECYSLVGGAGTRFGASDNHVYARIDNPPSSPGYFTAK